MKAATFLFALILSSCNCSDHPITHQYSLELTFDGVKQKRCIQTVKGHFVHHGKFGWWFHSEENFWCGFRLSKSADTVVVKSIQRLDRYGKI